MTIDKFTEFYIRAFNIVWDTDLADPFNETTALIFMPGNLRFDPETFNDTELRQQITFELWHQFREDTGILDFPSNGEVVSFDYEIREVTAVTRKQKYLSTTAYINLTELATSKAVSA
jgi:hypothetical protein